jgi:hypothetical protein
MNGAEPNTVRFTADSANPPYARLRRRGKASRRPRRPLRPAMVSSGEWHPETCDSLSYASPICFQTAFGKAPSPVNASVGPNRWVALHRGWRAAGAGVSLGPRCRICTQMRNLPRAGPSAEAGCPPELQVRNRPRLIWPPTLRVGHARPAVRRASPSKRRNHEVVALSVQSIPRSPKTPAG